MNKSHGRHAVMLCVAVSSLIHRPQTMHAEVKQWGCTSQARVRLETTQNAHDQYSNCLWGHGTHLCSAACFLSRLAAVNTAHRVWFCWAASPSLLAERSRMRCRSYRSAVCPITCAKDQMASTHAPQVLQARSTL